MKCKNCQHFNKSNHLELSNEFIDITGICNISGAQKKSKDNCPNGNFVHK